MPVLQQGEEFETGLENARFPGTYCLAPANVIQENVTDSYVGTILVRNLPNPNWSTDADVKWYDEIILQLTIDASELTFAELQLQSVTVTVEDPNNPGVTVAQRTFHKGDKVALEEFQFSKYYEDAHFCTWHNSSNLCPVFYDEDSTRVNAFYFSDIQARIGDICQLTGDTSIKDYFSFLPSNWFASLQLPEISVQFDALATIEFCDGRSERRRMLQGSTITTVNYVQYGSSRNIQTILFTGEGNSTSAPTTPVVPTSAPTTAAPATTDDVNIPLIAGLAAGASVSCCFFIFIATRKRGGRDKDERYDRIQYN